jgi:hypothetical protein
VKLFVPLAVVVCAAALVCFLYLHKQHPGAVSPLEVVGGRLSLGTAPADQKVAGQIPLRNRSALSVAIDAIRPDCGCTDAYVDKPNLAPGEQTVLHVTFNTSGYFREVHKSVLISMRDITQLPTVVGIDTYVQVGHRLNLQSIDLGEAAPGEPLPGAQVKVLRDPRADDEPVQIEGDLSGLILSKGQWTHLNDMDTRDLTFSAPALSLPPGRYTRLCKVVVGSDKPMPLSIAFTVTPSVLCDPPAVDLQIADPSHPYILLKLHAQHPGMVVKTIASSFNACAASVDATDPSNATLRVSSKADAANQAFDILRITCTLNGGKDQTLNVPVMLHR